MFGEQWEQFICIYNVHGTDCALESDKHYIINRGT